MPSQKRKADDGEDVSPLKGKKRLRILLDSDEENDDVSSVALSESAVESNKRLHDKLSSARSLEAPFGADSSRQSLHRLRSVPGEESSVFVCPNSGNATTISASDLSKERYRYSESALRTAHKLDTAPAPGSSIFYEGLISRAAFFAASHFMGLGDDSSRSSTTPLKLSDVGFTFLRPGERIEMPSGEIVTIPESSGSLLKYATIMEFFTYLQESFFDGNDRSFRLISPFLALQIADERRRRPSSK